MQMACSCKKNKSTATYTATFADGSTQTYKSEVEAKYAVVRKGGKYKAN
jgi:hypothetical protein